MKFYLALLMLCALSVNAQNIMQQVDSLEGGLQYGEAYTLLSESTSTATCAPCNLKLAHLAYKAGYLKHTIKHAEDALKTDSTNTQLWLLLTQAHDRRGNKKAALRAAEQLILLEPEKAAYHKLIAPLYVQNQLYSEAIHAYMQALELNRTDEEAAYAVSKLLYRLEMYKGAEHIALQFIALEPEHPGFLNLIPKIHYQLKNYKDAVFWSGLAIHHQDTSAEIMKILATSMVRTEQYDSALLAFDYLIRENEMNEGSYFHLAYAYEKKGMLDSAAVNYRRAVNASQSPNLGQFYLRLAISLDGLKDYPGAIANYKEAYQLLQSEEILYYLARAYDNYYEDKRTAVTYYQRYLDQSDTNSSPSRDYAAERISEIRGIMHFKLDSL